MESNANNRPWSWGSSDVDWCESNYMITSHVAEFWNTVSNFLFFIMPPLLMYLFRPYSQYVCWRVNIVWLLLVVVGIGSVYFHATLSLLGQLLDEIAIIWVVLAAFALWYPKRHMPAFFHQNRKSFEQGMLVFAVLTTGLACIWPAVNCMVLFILGVPATYLLVAEMKRTTCQRFYELGVRCGITWIFALTSWATDSLLCGMFKAIGFPYMHCFWHIFIFLASYSACVLFAYLDACLEMPELNPVLLYWPSDRWQVFGVPYISVSRMDRAALKAQRSPIIQRNGISNNSSYNYMYTSTQNGHNYTSSHNGATIAHNGFINRNHSNGMHTDNSSNKSF